MSLSSIIVSIPAFRDAFVRRCREEDDKQRPPLDQSDYRILLYGRKVYNLRSRAQDFVMCQRFDAPYLLCLESTRKTMRQSIHDAGLSRAQLSLSIGPSMDPNVHDRRELRLHPAPGRPHRRQFLDHRELRASML
jgi:hypothetical protein